MSVRVSKSESFHYSSCSDVQGNFDRRNFPKSIFPCLGIPVQMEVPRASRISDTPVYWEHGNPQSGENSGRLIHTTVFHEPKAERHPRDPEDLMSNDLVGENQ